MPFTKLKGRDLLLCDVLYQKPSKKTNWKDYITFTYRDLVKNTKEKFIIEEPTIELYVVKPEFRTFKKQRHHLTVDMVDTKVVKYKDVQHEIAKIAGKEWEEAYRTHTRKERRAVFKYPYCLGGDISIETYYRVLWKEQVGFPEKAPLQKIFLDIEIDQIDYEGNIARHGECPVNGVTIIDDNTDVVHTFLLNEPKNPQIKEFISSQDKFQERLHKEFDERNGVFQYKIYMFESEIELITELFKLINTICGDFCHIWNMGFDIPYLIDRLSVLGVNPASVICSLDFPTDSLYYFEDKYSFDFANKRDYFSVSANTHYLDQCIDYASLRKSQGVVKKVNLDAVAAKEHVPGKITYKSKATIRTLPYVDYELFVIYNIGDVLTQVMIERKVKDTDNLYLIASTNNVGYVEALKQTVTFRGLMYGYLREHGYVLGHNINAINNPSAVYDENGEIVEPKDEDEEDSYEGAINGNPMYNLKNGLLLYGKPSRFLYGLTVDFDFSAMYPNIICVFNIFATCMIGKVYIFKFKPKNAYDEDVGKEYIEDLITNDLDLIGSKWHNLSTVDKLAMKIKEKYNL